MARKRGIQEASGYTILVIDDQEEILISVRLLLERDGHRVLTASNGKAGLALFRQERVHLVIVDYFMPQMTGEEMVREIRKTHKDVQILLQTGYAGEKPPLDTLRALDIQGYHSKTDGPEYLLLWVEAALKAANHLEQVRATELLKAECLIKQEFLGNISHEMRSRLHVILGYSDLLLLGQQSEPPSKDLRLSIEAIQRHGRALWGLANNFLNFVKLDAETMRISLRSFPLSDLKTEFCEMMDFFLLNKPVVFVWEVDPRLPLVWADRDKLCIILQNLLTNAIKFTAAGEIRLSAFPSPSCDKIYVQIKDTGIGIAPVHHEEIFETFRQITAQKSQHSHEEARAGVGIGLGLARRLARMMDGEITVESEVGEGSTFTLSLSVPEENRHGNEVAFPHTAQSNASSALLGVPSPQAHPLLSL